MQCNSFFELNSDRLLGPPPPPPRLLTHGSGRDPPPPPRLLRPPLIRHLRVTRQFDELQTLLSLLNINFSVIRASFLYFSNFYSFLF